MASATPKARLAIDIGGTFTDLALERGDRRWTVKVLTTPSAPEQGVMDGVARILEESGVAAGELDLVIHGTTLATNAIIERKGARTALVTTEGFRDVIQLGTESRFEQYDVNLDLPEPLVPRWLRLPVPERVRNDGKVLLPLDEQAVEGLVPTLEAEGVESLAIGFLHSFVTPDHECRARDILAKRLPDMPITLSCEVSPEMREFERFSTACANAYVQPLMARYLTRLAERLQADGVGCPLFMMLSGGGLATLDTAVRFPIRLVESGPAGGAIFASEIAAEMGLDKVLSYDMGGTTAKVCLIDDGRPQTARTFEVARVYRFRKGSGLPLRIPVIEMVEIGAGGGSIAHVDRLGVIAVGPESAGAEPGPACYGNGGGKPTVTDANLLLGRFDPDAFAGGRIRLDTAAAEAAMQSAVGGPQKLEPRMAALGVIEIVDENMSNAARVHAIESGKGFDDRTLIAFGGGGPVHAARVAEKLGIGRVVVPTSAGVGSAVGFLRAPVAYEVIRSLYQRLGSFDVDAVNAMFDAMSTEARDTVRLGAGDVPVTETRIGYMRYVGQGHEIAVALPARRLGAGDVEMLQKAYDDEYRHLYNRLVPQSDVEVLSWAVTVTTAADREPSATRHAERYEPEPAGRREVFDTTAGKVVEVAIHERASLRAGARIPGPAIVVEDETSTVVTGGFDALINDLGYIELLARQAAGKEKAA
ncbi:MAG: hydantoinase/oxoprolinase family protein [Acetobacterales bacterium]